MSLIKGKKPNDWKLLQNETTWSVSPKGEVEYQSKVMDNQNQGWKDELVLIIVCLPIVILAWSIFSGDPHAKEKLDMFFEYFNNFPEFYKWLVVGIFGSIYGLKPGIDLLKKK
jgi:hypothetical protein